MTKEKLGILGGSFDPIHNGHLGIAKAMEKALGLSKILFIPAYISPFKQGKEAAPSQDRYTMVQLAIKNEPTWFATDMELTRTGVSYTYNTLETLAEKYGVEYDLYFIIGADSAVELDKWYRIKDALKLCTFVVAARPGVKEKKEGIMHSLEQEGLTNVLWVDTEEFPISSTEIRNRLKAHLSIRGLVPKEIVEYIEQRDLYQQ